jgi:peptidoglycan glycosyltransferase
VNVQIRRLFLVLCLLFVAVVATTTYWLWRAPDLEARRGNPTLVVRQLTIKRGLIYLSDGRTVLARNRIRKTQGRTFYLRVYPQGGLAAHVVGYSTVVRARAGLEESMNDFLTSSNSNLSTVVDRTLDRFRGLTRVGNDLVLTLQPEAQRVATEQLRGTCGAAVALDPRTGAVLAMASSPTYDPNLVEDDFREVLQTPGACPRPAALLNRATQGLFIPGSTFKVVTAAAALESGRYTPETPFDDPGYCIVYGKRVFNYSDQGVPSGFGNVSLTEALQNSINSVFCDIGKDLGPQAILEQARRFGFYEVPPLETPEDERVASGLYRRGKLYFPEDPNAVDPGRLGFGQERLLATPLQMAMVAAGVANGGLVMEPFVVDRIVKPDGEILTKTQPDELSQATSRQTATQLAAMMELAVESGTGTAAQIPGVRVAGKTGTAETGRPGANDTWFIAFAPVDNPRVAVAVALSDQAGTGGATAAPVARAIMEAVLG